MSIPNATLLDRIHKLLALGHSPNLHEAAGAAARAQALISRHRLEAYLEAEAAIAADPIEDGREAPLERSRKIRKWKIALACALAEANGGVAWVLLGEDADAICVAGRAPDREAIRALWDALAVRVEWLSATAGPGRSRAWHEAFRVGAADVIGERLAAGEVEARSTFVEEALVRIDPRVVAQAEALDRFVAERFGPAKGRRHSVDARAYERGRASAAELDLTVAPKGDDPRARRRAK